MKYLFSILFLVLALSFSNEAKAQQILTLTRVGVTDTVVNTATVNLTLTVRGKYQSGVIQVVNTKVDGTVAGNSLLQASVDGTNYVTLDTLTNTNVATNTKIFVLTNPAYPYYRISNTGTGTVRYVTTARAHFK